MISLCIVCATLMLVSGGVIGGVIFLTMLIPKEGSD